MKKFPSAGYAIFCDDIREESRGTHVLVGVYSEPIGISNFPVKVDSLFLYCKIAYDPTDLPADVRLSVHFWEGEEISSTDIDIEEMREHGQIAIRDQDPFASMTITYRLEPRALEGPCKIAVSTIVDGEQQPIGFIEFAHSVVDEQA